MRSDHSLYIIALLCFLLALLIFMSHTQNPPVHLTSGDETTDLVAMMFLPILGLVIVGVGYGVRPKKAMHARAKRVPPPPPSKPKKKTY